MDQVDIPKSLDSRPQIQSVEYYQNQWSKMLEGTEREIAAIREKERKAFEQANSTQPKQ